MLADVKEWLREEPRQALALGISAVALLLSFLEVVPGPVDPAWLAVLLCGVPIIKEGAEGLFTRFDIKADVLVSLALLASVIIGEIFAAGEVAFIMQLGALLEERTVAKARAGIERLVHLTPRTARRLDGTAESIIPAEEVRVDDLLRVLPGETIPVDGIIVSGQTAIDQSVMTGESLPVDKGPGDTVSSGTVNQFGAFDMRAVKVGEDSSLQRMIRLVQSADAGKARIVSLADRWATWIVVTALTAAAGTWIVTGEVLRAVTILVVFCPCALVLATPTAIVAAIGNLTQHGILVREGDALERLAEVKTCAFDKTGTLTQSRPEVARVVPAAGFDENEVLRLSACLEEHFPHPVARAVVHGAEERNLRHAEEHTEVEYVVAHGIASHWKGKRVLLGSRHYLSQDEHVDLSPMEEHIAALSREGYSLLYLAVDGSIAGIIAMEDPLRPESPALIRRLREMGVSHVLMLTGDDVRTASVVAEKLGITEFRAQVLPEDKARVVRELREEGRTVLMLGDGINDSPALSSADVGVTLRDGADLAREVADVVLMGGSLKELVTALELGRGAMRRIHFNFATTMVLNSVFLFGGLAGLLQPGISAVLHNLTTLGVSLNAMRPALPRGE